MIPKIGCGGHFGGLLAYCEDKPVQWVEGENGVEEWAGSERLAVVNFTDGSGWHSSAAELSGSLHSWSARAKRIEKPVFHASLSFPPGDLADNSQAVAIATEFLRDMGYGEVPAVIYRHYDTAHPHLHIAASRVGEDGRKINAFNEAKVAISICRRLERKYGLTPVKSAKAVVDLSVESLSPTDLIPGKPFKKVVIQNLQYYLNREGIEEMAALQACLRRHQINMVTSDGDGRPFIREGVIFYRMDKGGRRSMLRGRDMGKGFGQILAARLTRNRELRARADGKWQRSFYWDPPDQVTQARYGPLLSSAYDELLKGAVYTPEDIRASLEGRGIKAEVFVSRRGVLSGLTILEEERRYRATDIFWQGRSLSPGVLKQNFVPRFTANAIRDHVNGLFSYYREEMERDQLGMAEMHLLLNRNGIRLKEEEGQHYLSFDRSGQTFRTSVEKLYGGFGQFLDAIGCDGSQRLNAAQKKLLVSAGVLCPAANLSGRMLYHALRSGNTKSIAKMTGRPAVLALTEPEIGRLRRSLLLWRRYRSLHHRLTRAETFLKRTVQKTAKADEFKRYLRALNERGVGLYWKRDPHQPELRKAELFLLDDPAIRLSAYDGPAFFSPVKWRELFDRLPAADREALAPTQPGKTHFGFDPEAMAALDRAEERQSWSDQGISGFDRVFASMLTAGGGGTMVNSGADRSLEEEEALARKKRRKLK